MIRRLQSMSRSVCFPDPFKYLPWRVKGCTECSLFDAAQSVQTFKATFDSTIGILRWLSTNGLRMFIQFWFAKQPLFWLPRGWVPGYVEWILAFPRAPTGSISIQVWGIACASVVQILSTALISVWALAVQQKEAENGKGEPMKMGVGGSKGIDGDVKDGRTAKKEL